MEDYDLYGIDAETLDDARMIVSSLTLLPFVAHESGYIGDYFLASGQGEEELKLRENIDPLDGEPAERDFAGHRFLLFINGTERGGELRRMLQSDPRITLLRHESL